jgi:hypothetical protein
MSRSSIAAALGWLISVAAAVASLVLEKTKAQLSQTLFIGAIALGVAVALMLVVSEVYRSIAMRRRRAQAASHVARLSGVRSDTARPTATQPTKRRGDHEPRPVRPRAHPIRRPAIEAQSRTAAVETSVQQPVAAELAPIAAVATSPVPDRAAEVESLVLVSEEATSSAGPADAPIEEPQRAERDEFSFSFDFDRRPRESSRDGRRSRDRLETRGRLRRIFERRAASAESLVLISEIVEFHAPPDATEAIGEALPIAFDEASLSFDFMPSVATALAAEEQVAAARVAELEELLAREEEELRAALLAVEADDSEGALRGVGLTAAPGNEASVAPADYGASHDEPILLDGSPEHADGIGDGAGHEPSPLLLDDPVVDLPGIRRAVPARLLASVSDVLGRGFRQRPPTQDPRTGTGGVVFEADGAPVMGGPLAAEGLQHMDDLTEPLLLGDHAHDSTSPEGGDTGTLRHEQAVEFGLLLEDVG